MGLFDEQYAQYYDLLYYDKDYEREATYISALINKYRPESKSILELGCGTGRHATIMRRLGYETYGIDRSDAFLRQCKSRGIECEQGTIIDFDADKKFDVCMATFHVFSYLTTDGELEAAFRNVRNHLFSNGLFIFDVWFTPAVLNLRPMVREKKASDEHVEITRIGYPLMNHSNNTVEVRYHFTVSDKVVSDVFSFEELHVLRYYDISEIELMATKTGFVLLKAEEFISGEDPSEVSWGVNFILQVQ